MQGSKSAFDMFRMFMPVIYCGGLLAYFLWLSGGSLEILKLLNLGPFLLGLGVIGLAFCIPLALKLKQLFRGPRTPVSDGGSGRPASDDGDGFDADAVVARYLAQRPVEAVPASPTPRATSKGGGPTTPTGFGRRRSGNS
jgi:hypothetical protein